MSIFTSSFINSDSTEKANAYLKHLTEQGLFNGSVLIAHDNKILLKKGYGLASYEFSIQNTPQTKFRIASISKPITALAIIQLQERNLLNVQDTLSTYIPDYPHGNTITIHNLLTHTSGIFNLIELPNIKTLLCAPTTIENEIDLFKDKPLVFEPGTKFAYSNSNYILLTYIIEKASGKPYGTFIKENILAPLGMKDTGRDDSTLILKDRATGYCIKDTSLQLADHLDMTWAQGSGGLYSTVDDLYLFDQALYTKKLLNQKSKDLLFTSYIPMQTIYPLTFTSDPRSYGYGWEVGTLFNKRYIGHWGLMNGCTSELLRFIDDKVVIILLSNFEHVNIRKIAQDLASFIFEVNQS